MYFIWFQYYIKSPHSDEGIMISGQMSVETTDLQKIRENWRMLQILLNHSYMLHKKESCLRGPLLFVFHVLCVHLLCQAFKGPLFHFYLADGSLCQLRPWFHPEAVTGQLIVFHFGMGNAPPCQKKKKLPCTSSWQQMKMLCTGRFKPLSAGQHWNATHIFTLLWFDFKVAQKIHVTMKNNPFS